ncbi:hypothetical protein V8G54_003137 [Vigna mungo]|uniref:Uncharacterized protein n=1 Tax=Vigna mungo TaxID=3915 RepID=A0AAQ3PDB8_VIGMU
MSFLRGTLMNLKRRSGVGTMGRVGKNLARKVRIWGLGHLGLTLSEILHMGATKTVPLKGLGERKWMRRQMATLMDSPKRRKPLLLLARKKNGTTFFSHFWKKAQERFPAPTLIS